MKKTFILLLGLSFVGAFFAVTTFAASRSYRFRGSGASYYQNIENYSQTNKQTRLPRYSSRRRLTRTNWSVIEKKNEAAKQMPSRRSTYRYQGSSYASSNTAVVQSQRSVKDTFQSFQAKNIDFKISLPEGFKVFSDTLQWESGEFVFQNGNAKIKIIATSDRCDAGVTYCLKAKSDAALEKFQETLPQMTMRQNKNRSLDSSQSQLKKENMGRFVDLYARDYGAGQLTFFNPQNESIWILSVIDPDHSAELLKNNRDLYKIFASLTQKSAISTKTSRISLNNILTRNRSTGRSTQNKVTLAFGNSAVDEFKAEKVPFHLELPKGFELISDTIDRSTGEMLFEKGAERIIITATEDLCNDQTPRLLRRCVDAATLVLRKELETEFPDARILQDENMQVQLTDVSASGQNFRRSSAFKNHVGRIAILRENSQRMGYFVFPEPETGYIWKMRMEAPEDKDAFLNDIRQKTKIINSLFFGSEE